MYYNDQTLRHKKTNELVRMAPNTPGNGKGMLLIRKDGTRFADDIRNYTHIEDEFGRAYVNYPVKGQSVDESAEKYAISTEEMAKMRQRSLEEWEDNLLEFMKKGRFSTDTPGKTVVCPFSDGSKCLVFQQFFLERRGAVPLFYSWNKHKNGFCDGPMAFLHTDGQLWMYDYALNELSVIKIKEGA